MTTSRSRTKRNSVRPAPLAATRGRGIALVAVLWVLVLLSVMAAGFLRDTSVETQVARNLLDNAEARALADAGVAQQPGGHDRQQHQDPQHRDQRNAAPSRGG